TSRGRAVPHGREPAAVLGDTDRVHDASADARAAHARNAGRDARARRCGARCARGRGRDLGARLFAARSLCTGTPASTRAIGGESGSLPSGSLLADILSAPTLLAHYSPPPTRSSSR